MNCVHCDKPGATLCDRCRKTKRTQAQQVRRTKPLERPTLILRDGTTLHGTEAQTRMNDDHRIAVTQPKEPHNFHKKNARPAATSPQKRPGNLNRNPAPQHATPTRGQKP